MEGKIIAYPLLEVKVIVFAKLIGNCGPEVSIFDSDDDVEVVVVDISQDDVMVGVLEI